MDGDPDSEYLVQTPTEIIAEENLESTAILNYYSTEIQLLARRFKKEYLDDCRYAQKAHAYLQQTIKPVYTLNELQPASITLQKRTGSCSQRIACLEALCRANGIATRVHGLYIDGRFWYPRFKVFRSFIPDKILLAWPQFYLAGKWVDMDELFGDAAQLSANATEGFTNRGETLFEAVEHTLVDFKGKSKNCGGADCATDLDLSRFVISDEGIFNSRDELFARYGSLQNTLRGRMFENIYGGRKSV
jgi:transglutaminase-like putative cysteine protease